MSEPLKLRGVGILPIKTIEQRRDELSMDRYQKFYKDICWVRQDTINSLIKAEDLKDNGVGG